MNSLWCSVDHAHATLAELARDFVVGDGGVDHGVLILDTFSRSHGDTEECCFSPPCFLRAFVPL